MQHLREQVFGSRSPLFQTSPSWPWTLGVWSLRVPQVPSAACSVPQEASIYGLHRLGLWLLVGFGKWEAQLGNQSAGKVGAVGGGAEKGQGKGALSRASTVFQSHCSRLLPLRGSGCLLLVPGHPLWDPVALPPPLRTVPPALLGAALPGDAVPAGPDSLPLCSLVSLSVKWG